MSDWLPAITIEDFTTELHRTISRRREVRPSYGLTSALERARRRYDVRIGAYRAFSPRRASRVERRVEARVDDVLCALGLPFAYDPVAHEFRAPTHLRVRWSWPRLPVWLAVSEASTRGAVVSLQLRSPRRWRYPLRYYAVAHDFLRGRADEWSSPSSASAPSEERRRFTPAPPLSLWRRLAPPARPLKATRSG